MKVKALFLVPAILFTLTAAADTTYEGSSFDEVQGVLSGRAIPATLSDEEAYELTPYLSGSLPHYKVEASSFVAHGINLLTRDAIRTTTQNDDYYPRLKKLLHPNGVCLTGKWVITESSPYTGYFSKGSQALFVGRASVAMSATEHGKKRGFGFAGKLFPTLNSSEQVKTANFFTVDVLFGTKAKHYTDVALTNEPEVGFDLSLIGLGFKIANALTKADEKPLFRPLYPIAELGVAAGAPVRTPHWMRLRPVEGTASVDERDFRNELNLRRNHPKGLRFDISVSDATKDSDNKKGWQKVGYIELNESFVSYGCDRQLHFAHPKLKK